MASIAYEGKKGERARLVFRDAAGKQQSLRLGRCSKGSAMRALAGFERVIESNRLGSTMHPDGVSWLAGLDDRVYARVVALGLAEPRKAAGLVTLGKLLAAFFAGVVVKPASLVRMK